MYSGTSKANLPSMSEVASPWKAGGRGPWKRRSIGATVHPSARTRMPTTVDPSGFTTTPCSVSHARGAHRWSRGRVTRATTGSANVPSPESAEGRPGRAPLGSVCATAARDRVGNFRCPRHAKKIRVNVTGTTRRRTACSFARCVPVRTTGRPRVRLARAGYTALPSRAPGAPHPRATVVREAAVRTPPDTAAFLPLP